MSHREFNAQRTMLANAMATAGAELLEYMGTEGALAAIPSTEPQQYVVAGTLRMIAKMLPGVEPTSPAVQAPSQVPAELSDADELREISAILEREGYRMSAMKLRQIAHRAGSSDVREKALEEAAKACEEVALHWQQFEDTYAAGKKSGAFGCAAAIRALKAEAPAASKEGDADA